MHLLEWTLLHNQPLGKTQTEAFTILLFYPEVIILSNLPTVLAVGL